MRLQGWVSMRSWEVVPYPYPEHEKPRPGDVDQLGPGPTRGKPRENVHLTGPQAMQTPVSLGQIKRTGPDGGSDGKESTCNTGDPGSILCWEDPLEEGTATHSSILAWRNHGQRRLADYSSWGHKESDTIE